MPGDFDEFMVNIGLGINFLAGGTFYFNSNDTLSYTFLKISNHSSHPLLCFKERKGNLLPKQDEN